MIAATRYIRRAAVLGAGVMGAQIAAHLANAGLPVLLYDLPAAKSDKNDIVTQALQGLRKLKPSPLASVSALAAIQPANYEEDLPKLKDCDLIIEAVTERLDVKHSIYSQLAPHMNKRALLASNTSGISIETLAQALPDDLRTRFCGVHFFNPPRYMHLVEVIAHADTRGDVLAVLEGFLTSTLGKGVIFANDTPGFIANRVGVFSMLTVLHHAERLGLPFDLVDKLTGEGIGRPKSATFRTADVVGLDTFAHVVRSMAEQLRHDPWASCYRVPEWIEGLIARGALGQKAGAGVYRKVGDEIQVLDTARQEYRLASSMPDSRVAELLRMQDPARKFRALRELDHPEAEFLLAIHNDLFHFCAAQLAAIAPTAREVDLAMRWGYGWRLGPFEMWQAIGWRETAEALAVHVAAGRAMSSAPLPEWVMQPGRTGVHGPQGSWSAAAGRMLVPSDHPVYRRQIFRQQMLGQPEPATKAVFETDAVRLWHTGDDIAVLSFKTKLHTIGTAVLDGVHQALAIAERDFKALVLWHPEPPFCAGANLLELLEAAGAGRFDRIESMVDDFQQTSLALRYAMVPTIAATQGLVLGGGCEFMLHCDRTVAALESHIGLVETGVGLVPAGGGCKELALRAADRADDGDLLSFLAPCFERAAKSMVSGSGTEAREWGYLRRADKIVFNSYELLHAAKVEANGLFELGYRAPLPRQDIPIAGASGSATLRTQLVNLLEGGFISAHDYEVARRLAHVLCGGDLAAGTRVSERWLLTLERKAFMELLQMDKTQQRIRHTLETGKPLRN
jgi:3-hydroxyacyl-CoA dehydrogenase